MESYKIIEPLLGTKAKVYFEDAIEGKKNYKKAQDIRLCCEKFIETVVFTILIDKSTKDKYIKEGLNGRINFLKKYFDGTLIDKLHELRLIGNKGTHEGEDAKISQDDIDKILNIMLEFSLEIFIVMFKTFGFECVNWRLTVFSTLPPIYRIKILEKYFEYDKSKFVIDKLMMAYLKDDQSNKATEFLDKCLNERLIDKDLFDEFIEKKEFLEENIDKFSIARSLEDSKNNFKKLLSESIDDQEKDSFILLMSIILGVDLFNDDRIVKNENEYVTMKVAIKVHGKSYIYGTHDNKIVISRQAAQNININKIDIISDKFKNIYKIAYIEDNNFMPYLEEDGTIIDICISTSFIGCNIEKFKKTILNEGANAKECYLIDGRNGIKFENKILVFDLEVRKNS